LERGLELFNTYKDKYNLTCWGIDELRDNVVRDFFAYQTTPAVATVEAYWFSSSEKGGGEQEDNDDGQGAAADETTQPPIENPNVVIRHLRELFDSNFEGGMKRLKE
jgi:hypothetical protein